MTLREIAKRLLDELEAGGESGAHRALWRILLRFLETYYGLADKNG
jgi:hypothetical protein